MTSARMTVLSAVGIFIIGLARPAVAAPGRVGCFYDLQLCEQNELCFNDSLFGTCVAQLSDAINYNDLEPEALGEAAQVLQYLIETGYKWQDSYTQCVVGKFLQSAVTHQRYDPEVCEYLKALLDVIDQNKGRVDQAPSAAVPSGTSEIGADVAPLQISSSDAAPHGEFMSQADMATDFDAPLPVEPMMPVQPQQNTQQDPHTFDLQQYLQAYQKAMAQVQPQNSDLITAQKKSDSSVVVIGSEAGSTTTEPSTTTTTTTATPTVAASADSLLSELNSTVDESDNMQAMRALYSLVNSYPAAGEQAYNGPALFKYATAPEAIPEDQHMSMGMPFSGEEAQPEMMLPPQMWQQQQLQNFPLQGAVQDIYVPDFSAIPPPEILQDMFLRSARAQLQAQPRISEADLLVAQALFGPPPQQQPPQMTADDFVGMMDPRMQMQFQQQQQMDPRMMMQQDPRMMMDLMAQMDPRMGQPQLDPRMLMEQTGGQFDPRMMQFDPRMMMNQQPQMDPRMLFGPGFGMNPNLMSSPPQYLMGGPQMDPAFMGMPMKRGGSDFMLSQPPPSYGAMPFMQGGPNMPFMDPRVQSMYAPAPYGFFPQGVALPFTQSDWRPPMSLPEGFVFAEQGFPVIEASVNESADMSDQPMTAFLGENILQQSDNGNGASGQSSPNKKDQEYRSLLPSDESQDVPVEDVTVTVVKGNAQKPIPSGDLTGTVVGDASDDMNVQDDDYVFLVTEPQLDQDQARYFLNWLAAVMSMPAQTFYDVNINDDLMTFRVNPAMDKLNATYVAQTLGGDDLRTGLRKTNNLEILRAGVGRYAFDDQGQLRFQQTAIVQSESAAAAEAEIAKKYDVVDPTFAFIVTEPALTYDKARRILNWLSLKLKVPQSIFSALNIEDHQLLFRVSPFYGQINASGVVDHLSDSKIQAALRQEFQVEIIRSGIGDRVQIVKADLRQRQTLLIGLIAVACVAAVLISLGIIYLVRRNIVMRKKLHGLGGDVESSKEYEELCRQRMACKNIEAAIGASPDYKTHDRTTHSSTSSWSEEPAPTNMDITTGHMVLSYMEDHLKHKERMSEEWASLCTYEADPSKTDAGSKLENLIKNRYPDVLPYDHTRVHLNPEVNSTKSDYVNANLITDADPKNAAYIATQGPLPDTVSDFWQMVWESNSTVIVMLTKLREAEQDLCHVYWPKEGSECYNIFEVHLVSEHIWCDDYLVRNFYLKNLQTHETRTVTQFHYLNWPNLGVPSSLKTFLEFRRKINKCYKGGSSPIVVHCSDGVDRTGAYCLIDLVLNRMAKGVKEIDIAATLEHLRDQRMDMVRTKDQFEFVLTAVAQEIQAILKSMPQK